MLISFTFVVILYCVFSDFTSTGFFLFFFCVFVFFQAEDGIRDLVRSRGLGDVYKRQLFSRFRIKFHLLLDFGIPVFMTVFLIWIKVQVPIHLLRLQFQVILQNRQEKSLKFPFLKRYTSEMDNMLPIHGLWRCLTRSHVQPGGIILPCLSILTGSKPVSYTHLTLPTSDLV